MRVPRMAIFLAAAPVFCGFLSSVLLFAQGGFGGGHGRFDFLIGLLTLPFSLLWVWLGDLPLPEVVQGHDLVLVVLFPAFVNAAFLFCVGLAITALRRKAR